MTLKAWKGSTMTYTQRNLFTTIGVLVEGKEHIKFQLDWLATTVEADHEELKKLKEAAVTDAAEIGAMTNAIEAQWEEIDSLKGSIGSYNVKLVIEEKWRKELQAKAEEQAAEIAALTKKLETNSKRSRTIIAELKGAKADEGTKKHTMTASKPKKGSK